MKILVHHFLYHSFIKSREQLKKAEVKESQAIGSVSILSKQYSMLAIKRFHKISNEIPLILHRSVNQMWKFFPLYNATVSLLELLMTQQVKHGNTFQKLLKKTRILNPQNQVLCKSSYQVL